MILEKSDKILLRNIFEAGHPIYPFVFFSKYKFSIYLLSTTVKKLIQLNLIKHESNLLSLTQEGKNYCVKNRRIFTQKVRKYSIKQDSSLNSTLADLSYIPNLKYLKIDVLKNKYSNK